MSDEPPRPSLLRTIAGRPIRLAPVLAGVSRHRIALILGFGVLLRVSRVLANLGPSMDEGSLTGNIVSRPFSGLFADLSHTQLAPAGFLVAEWLACRTLGSSLIALRLIPLLGAVVSVFLFLDVARRSLRPEAVWLALALFAVAEDTIAYGAQIKQYSTDVALGLACTTLGLRLASRALTTSSFLVFATFGASVVWFSHPSAFVLAGVGGTLILSAMVSRHWRRALLLMAMSAVWASSFAVVYAVSMDQLGHRPDMWAFWNFAFPPIPPRSLDDLSWPIRRFLYLFVNPLNFLTLLGPIASILPPLVFFVLGTVALWRWKPETVLILSTPLLLTFLASSFRFYPFHGRLLLFLIPCLLLPIAGGLCQFRLVFPNRLISSFALASVLLFPTLNALFRLIEADARMTSHPLGDLRETDLRPENFPFPRKPDTPSNP